MVLTSRTNKWASRLIIILQLATWSAVSVVLLQKGVSSLQRRILETSSDVIKTDLSHEADIESTILPMKHVQNRGYDLAIISDKEESSLGKKEEYRNLNKAYLLSPVITIDSMNKHIETNKYQLQIIKESEKSRNSQIKINQYIDNLQRKNASNNVSRTTRGRLVKNKNEKEEAIMHSLTTKSITSVSKQNNADMKFYDFVENPSTIYKPSTQILLDDTQRVVNTQRSKSKIEFSHMSSGGTAVAITMVVIGSIMLILGPIVLILRTLDKKRQMKKFIKLSRASAREEQPPTYEQAILIDETPRYSTLVLNGQIDEHLSQS